MESLAANLSMLLGSAPLVGKLWSWDMGLPEVPAPVALGAIALVGYLWSLATFTKRA